MKVVHQTAQNIDTDRWAYLYDTSDQLASDVRRDIKKHIEEIIVAGLEADGLLLPKGSK